MGLDEGMTSSCICYCRNLKCHKGETGVYFTFSGLMILMIPAKGNLTKIVYIFYTRFFMHD